MLWATFVRTFGELRRMGMAKRDRERPDLKPASAVEVLWYRGLVGRAFLSVPPANEPQEYAYIPEDLLPLLPILRTDAHPPLGRPATPNESAHPILADVGGRVPTRVELPLPVSCAVLAMSMMEIEVISVDTDGIDGGRDASPIDMEGPAGSAPGFPLTAAA